MNSLRKIILYKLLCYSFAFFSMPVLAIETAIKEDTIKAIYSFKFGKFTEWSESKLSNSQTTLGFCILGENPFGQTALDAIEGKRLKGKTLKIKFFESGLLANEALADCHIVFVSQSEKQRVHIILDAFRFQQILTVSDIEGFSAKGGMITLIKSDNQISFEINPYALSRAGLSISSKILELAIIVNDSDIGETP